MRRFLWVSAAIMAADQITKWAAVKYLARHVEVAVTPFLNFILVFNRGAAFGFLSSASGWQNGVFAAIALVVTVFILRWLSKMGPHDKLAAVGMTLILGGALGNLVDRLWRGYVVDFIDFHFWSWHFWTFNIADSAITIGAMLLILDAFGIGKGRVVVK